MSDHFNRLTPPEAERLAYLIEECGEVIQAATKVLRHGFGSRHPYNMDGPTNRQNLETELGHMTFALALVISCDDVNGKRVEASSSEKANTIRKYLHHHVKPEDKKDQLA
jgi:NTP pyrophosphatase (non-canonical NTP hydrolase)